MNLTRALVITAALTGVVTSNSSAAPLLYDNGAPNQASGAEMTQWLEADDFTLTSGAILSGVRFWSVQDDVRVNGITYQGSISWQIYASNGAQPGALLASGNTSAVTRVATGKSLSITQGGLPEYQNDFALPNVMLGPGTYWLGLHNGPLTTTTFQQFYWESTNPNATAFSVNDLAPFDGGWAPNVGDTAQLAFQVFGDSASDVPAAPVPEPASLVLLGSGLTAVLRKRGPRRRTDTH